MLKHATFLRKGIIYYPMLQHARERFNAVKTAMMIWIISGIVLVVVNMTVDEYMVSLCCR